jgi:hypothetical protein
MLRTGWSLAKAWPAVLSYGSNCCHACVVFCLCLMELIHTGALSATVLPLTSTPYCTPMTVYGTAVRDATQAAAGHNIGISKGYKPCLSAQSGCPPLDKTSSRVAHENSFVYHQWCSDMSQAYPTDPASYSCCSHALGSCYSMMPCTFTNPDAILAVRPD